MLSQNNDIEKVMNPRWSESSAQTVLSHDLGAGSKKRCIDKGPELEA